jgi:hypothetical protein
MVKLGGHKDKEKTTHDEIADQLDAMEIRKLDQTNPMEQARKFDMVRQNPPEPGFMKVTLEKKTDEKGLPYVESVSTNDKGIEKRIREDPFFTIDLYSAVQANIAKCPSNVGPMLLDQQAQLIMNEKKEFKPEKRKNDFSLITIMLVGMSIVGAVIGILYIMG